jgi:hypothetical protein
VWDHTLGPGPFKLVVRDETLSGSRVGVRLNNDPLLEIFEEGSRVYLTGSVALGGDDYVSFDRNRIEVYSASTDLRFEGKEMRVEARGKELLRLKFNATDKTIELLQLRLECSSGSLELSTQGLEVKPNNSEPWTCRAPFGTPPSGSQVTDGVLDLQVPSLGARSSWSKK